MSIGGSACTSLRANTATSITCTTPSGSAGTASVLVTTAAGTNVANTLYTYADPTYSVTYNGNTSTGGGVPTDSATYANGASVSVLGNSGSLAKTGYTFDGWNTLADGTGTARAAASTFTMGGAAVTLYARWTINSYTVTFDANTGTGTMPAQSVNYNVATALTANTLTKTGYTFTGWNHFPNGSGTAFANSASFAFSGDITLYAQWTPIPAPTVTAISPNSGTTLGGTSVTITGTNLSSATGVTIGGNACTPLSANSATSATCTTAAHAAGAVSVLVTTSGGTNAANTLYTFVTPAAPEPVVPFIPPLTSLPLVPGVSSSLLTVLNLSGGAGPALTGCLRDTLSTQLGSEWLYQGQGADGGARLGQAEQAISFYALDASSSTNHGLGQGAGIYQRGANSLEVVTACGTFVTAPAMYNMGEFGALLQAAGLTVQINAQGVMTVQVGAIIYVARPDYLVTQGTPGAPGLTTGADGLMRFTDSAGHIQILYPAFLDPEVLGNQVAVAVSGYLVVQTDGTGLVTLLSGEKFVLTPDLTLGTVPPEFSAVGWWQDGPNHYRYRSSSFSNTSQGFTVTPR